MITRCETCHAGTLASHDPHPLTALGEALAWIANRPTATVARTPDGWVLHPRTVAEIQTMPPGLCDVLPLHACGAPQLPVQASVHAPGGQATKKALEAAYGTPTTWRGMRAVRCRRCQAWCLHGYDDDVMAFAHLADPWPVDPDYGRAIAAASGRLCLRVIPVGSYSALHHPWNPVPWGKQPIAVLPVHECGNPLPSNPLPAESVRRLEWDVPEPCPF